MTCYCFKRIGLATCASIAAFMPAVATADVIGDCSLTGYTFMGGGSAYASTPSGPSNQKDYFLAQPLNYDYSGVNMWGYSWIKFDELAESPVESAYLVIDLLGVGSMSVVEATPETPAMLDVYDPGDTDVEDLASDSGLRSALRDELDASAPLFDTLVMTGNGLWSADITDLYNGWVTGEIENNGLVLACANDHEIIGSKYASFGNEDGVAPYIASAAVPEPTALALLACGVASLAARRRGGSN